LRPEAWPEVTLGKLLRVKHGFAFKGEHFRSTGEALVLTPGNFRIGGGLQLREGKERYYAADYADEFRLLSGDLLIAMTDLTQRSPILGSPLVVPAEGTYLHNQRLGKIEILDRDRLDPDFAYFLFVSDAIRSQLRGSATGSTVRHTAPGRIYSAIVHLPPIASQRKIAAIISAYDGLIGNNNRRIKVLEEIAQRIYREWFVDFRYPGHENVPLVDSELGAIPEGWEVRTIGDAASRERYAVTSGPFGSKLGTKDYVSRGVPVIRGTNLAIGGGFRDSDFVFVSRETADGLPSCQAHPGDILVTQRGTLGQVGLIPSSARFKRYVISQSQMKITVDRETGDNEYLYATLRSSEVTARLQRQAMTAGVPHINLAILRAFPVVWPPLALRKRLAAVSALFGEQVDTLTLALKKTRAARDLLLPRLVSGEIDVTDLGIVVTDLAT
jgi:type I restriction enzyme, S subunit